MKNKHVLIIDDEPDIRALLEITIEGMGLAVTCAEDKTSAFEALESHSYCLCLTDMRLPDGDGIDIVKHIQTHFPNLPVAVITAYGNVEGAVNTLKAGAFDYVSKPIDLEMLQKLISTAMSICNQPTGSKSNDLDLIGRTRSITQLRQDIIKLARSQAPVFIYGQSGVGKELVANLIHSNGPRAEGPFIPVNCGAIPSELMESEFFGHKKGSFTGAISDHEGLFQAAQGGTLFLDEIAELPIAMQVKLLRAIQEKAIKPIGQHKELPVDVRILSASHKNLLDEIKKENFRQDLYYRINVIELKVPSLVEHKEDIPLLVKKFINNLNTKESIPEVTQEAHDSLMAYDFPGNVRELENILERALTLCDGKKITTADLQLPSMNTSDSIKTKLEVNQLENYLDEQQREVIIQALDDNKWNRTATAKQLGISFRALRYRLKKLGIE